MHCTQQHRWLCSLASALALLIQAAQAASYEAGREAVYARDYLRAIEKLSPLAQQGNSEAQYWLGISYRMGRPAEDFTDMQNELHWYKAAADLPQSLRGCKPVEYSVALFNGYHRIMTSGAQATKRRLAGKS